MKYRQKHVSIVIINWNGWEDTIECLESVLKLSYENYNIILVDNHSTDGSIVKFKEWASGSTIHKVQTLYPALVEPYESKPLKLLEIDDDQRNDFKNPIIPVREIILIKNSENRGFARANNQAMRLAKEIFNSKYYFLLNNDTIIERQSLSSLVETLEKDPRISAGQATIMHYEDGKLDHAGGMILIWGQTKYFKKINENEIKRISFISGCALFVRAKTMETMDYLTEKFFHGEEDFEFSMRCKGKKMLLICLSQSKVYHKTGKSVNKLLAAKEKAVFLFALNRIIDMKNFYPVSLWYIWKIPTLIYFGYLFWLQNHLSLNRTYILLKQISRYTANRNDVRKETLEKILIETNLQ